MSMRDGQGAMWVMICYAMGVGGCGHGKGFGPWPEEPVLARDAMGEIRVWCDIGAGV